jgi:predicted alpha/beta hydrolase family esterase
VEQADWLTPRREDWVAALAEAIAADSTPVILIAHSLGCITVAHWAATAPVQFLRQVRGALLVAPADVERPACAPALRNFAPIPGDLLPSVRHGRWRWRATGALKRGFWRGPGTSM